MTHIVCYSGGHSSALVAIEVVRRFGTDDVTLLNHDIHPNSEDADIKRFKREVADYLKLPVTYANREGWEENDQFSVCVKDGGFKYGWSKMPVCTHQMKTEPFKAYLDQHYTAESRDRVTIYYGFDAGETARIQRRSSHLGALGFRTDYPLALWQGRTIRSTTEVGILPPLTYSTWKHANCVGCLKAKRQHWYCVFCLRQDIWARAKWAEDEIGYSILPDVYMEELEPLFGRMQAAGVVPTEKVGHQAFWRSAKKMLAHLEMGQASLLDVLATEDAQSLPCECVV